MLCSGLRPQGVLLVLSFFRLRRICYAVALLIIGALILMKRRRERSAWGPEEEDDEDEDSNPSRRSD